MKKNEIALVATLFNRKKVLLEINHTLGKCNYRYLTNGESTDMQLDTSGNYFWLETPIHSTVENGEKIVFVTIEATPIVLHRQQVVPVKLF